MFQAEAGPGFVTGRVFQRFSEGNKLGSYDAAAPAHDRLIGHAQDMDDSKMHEPNFRAVIVDHGDCGLVCLGNGYLFHQLAPHSLVITKVVGKESMIFLGNVPADSNRIQSVQPGFLPAFAASIPQYLIVAEYQDVRDELFVAFVLFGIAAVQVENLGGGGHHRQVSLHFQAESLKHPEFLEEFPLKTKHSFFSCHSSIWFSYCRAETLSLSMVGEQMLLVDCSQAVHGSFNHGWTRINTDRNGNSKRPEFT